MAIKSWRITILALLLLAGALASNMALRDGSAHRPPSAYRLALVPMPAPRLLVATPVALDLTDPAGRAVTGARVRLDLTMPGMAMPPNQVTARPVPGSPGRYRADAVFTMKGAWWIEAIAESPPARAVRLVEVP